MVSMHYDRLQTRGWFPALIIVAGVLVIFGRIIVHDYVLWDDDALLLANPAVMTPSFDALKLAWQGPHEHLYVPLTYNLWFLIARAANLFTQGATPAAGWFHAASIAVHIANALLVYALLRSLQVLRPESWRCRGGAVRPRRRARAAG